MEELERTRELIEKAHASDDDKQVVFAALERIESGDVEGLKEQLEEADLKGLRRVVRALLRLLDRMEKEQDKKDYTPHHGYSPPMYAYGENIKTVSIGFSESVRLVEADSSHDGDVWDVEMIREGMNLSGTRFYTGNALDSIVPFINGLQCFVDHPTQRESAELPERSIRDLLGWYTDGVVEGDTVKAKLHFVTKGPAADIAEMIKEAAVRGNPNLVGLSIRGTGDTEVVNESGRVFERVHKVTDLMSADAVTRPGAGGRLLSLAESENEELRRFYMELGEMKVEDILKARPDLVQALAADAEEAKKKDEEYEYEEPEKKETEEAQKKGYKAPDDEEEEEEMKKKPEDSKEDTKEETMERKDGELEEAKRPHDGEDEKVLTEARSVLEELNKARSEALLERKLGASALPEPLKEQIRSKFSDKTASEEEVESALEESQGLYDKLFGSTPNQREFRPGVKVTRDPQETVARRMEAMLKGQPVEYDGEKYEPFSGLIEAYHAHKGWVPTYPIYGNVVESMIHDAKGYSAWGGNLQESLGQISSFSTLFGNAMNRVLLAAYREEAGLNWRWAVSHLEVSRDLRPVKFSRTGGYTVTPAVAEGGTYQEATFPSEEAITLDPSSNKFGVLQPVTKEAFIRDDVRALQRVPVQLARAFKFNQYKTIFDWMANNSNVWDGNALAVTAAHSNYSTTALAASAVEDGIRLVRSQTAPGSTDRPMGLRPRYLIVPNELDDLAFRLTMSAVGPVGSTGNAATEPNILRAKYGLQPVVIDYWTDATNWWLMTEPRPDQPTWGVVVYPSEEPQLEVQDDPTAGSVFTADKVTFKVSGYFVSAPLDYRTFQGNIVAG